VGTRGSKLALAQTGMVARELQALHAGLSVQTVVIKTTGDVRSDLPFAAVGTKGMFVKEIEEALLAGEIDFAVHSMKDMPGELAKGLSLAAVPRRVDPRDALISPTADLNELPDGAKIGTSSLRRRAQLLSVRPDLSVGELRGNLDTRLRKLDEGQYDAIVLAAAGLERLGLSGRIRQRLPIGSFIPAPGQGVLALETRANYDSMRLLLAPMNDPDAADCVAAERAFQAELGAGCTVPVGGHGILETGELRFQAMLYAPDGSETIGVEMRGPRESAIELGRSAAREILERGGKRLLESAG